MKQHGNKRFQVARESSSRSLHAKVYMYTDPTRTVKLEWVLIFKFEYPLGIRHERLGRMTESTVFIGSIFWHLPTSDQQGFIWEVGPDSSSDLPWRELSSVDLEDLGCLPLSWRPRPVGCKQLVAGSQSRREREKKGRPQASHCPESPASLLVHYSPCLKSTVKVECVSPLTFRFRSPLSPQMYMLYFILLFIMYIRLYC